VAIETLQSRYGKTEVIINTLYAELQKLPMAQPTFDNIKATFDNMERILRQLTTLGEDISQQRLLVQQILSKFPLEVTVKLEEARFNTGAPWTVKTLRQAIQRFMDIRSNAKELATVSDELHTTSLPTIDAPVTTSRYRQQPEHQLNQPRRYNSSARKPCTYCQGNHNLFECRTFPTTTIYLSAELSLLLQPGRGNYPANNVASYAFNSTIVSRNVTCETSIDATAATV